MPDFKKNRFSTNSRPFNKGGGRDFGPKELYDASCNNCHKACQVPFRPNGKKPVYCSDCFKQQGGGDESHFERRPFEKRSFDRPQRHEAPAPDRRIDDLKRQMDAMQSSIDRLATLIENSNRSNELGKEVRKHVPAAKPASAPKKVAAAKVAPKEAAKKSAAPAKKAAKKTAKSTKKA